MPTDMPPEIARVIANIPELRDFYAQEYLKAELAVQQAMNERDALSIKQQDADALLKKNDLEEQRNAELLRQGTKMDVIYALLTSLVDAHQTQHHEPTASMLNAIHAQLSVILKAQSFVIAEFMNRPGAGQGLSDLFEQMQQYVEDNLMRRMSSSPPKSQTIIYAGETPTNVNAPNANIHKMHIGEK